MTREEEDSGITLPVHQPSFELDDDAYHSIHVQQRARLGALQRRARDLGIPVIMLLEGWYGSGISQVGNDLNRTLDPRGFSYYPISAPGPLAREHHFLWRFWIRTPPRGRIAIFDRGWYARTILDRIDPRKEERVPESFIDEIRGFERALTDSGFLLIKMFLHISRKEQKQRLKKIKQDPLTMGYIRQDMERYIKYRHYLPLIEDFLSRTHTGNSPWHVIDAGERKYTIVTIFDIIERQLEEAVGRIQVEEIAKPSLSPELLTGDAVPAGTTGLASIDLSRALGKEEYDSRMVILGRTLAECQALLFREKIPLIIVFEGWDAAGKGGAIMRVTRSLNPRGYTVMPVGPPDQGERTRHYLWRFFPALPGRGQITIFDRSWYGRVLVERVEGLCRESEWTRAYREIREFEHSLTKDGAIMVKLWLHIDRDEQLKRFRERERDPNKQWKITDEDWRNRSRWDEYEKAVNQMIALTSTPAAPWTIIESNDKYYSRVKTLQSIIDAVQRSATERSRTVG